MADFYEVRLTVRLPDGVNATPAEVDEWLRFCLRDTHSMSGVSPLVRFEPEPLRGTFRILPTAGFRCDPASGVPAGAPGRTDAERAAWLADKIVALGDYAKEAAAMLRRWPDGVAGNDYHTNCHEPLMKDDPT